MPKSSEYRRIYRRQAKLWEGLVVFLNQFSHCGLGLSLEVADLSSHIREVQACANEQLKPSQSIGGRRFLIIFGEATQRDFGRPTSGMVWESSNMTEAFIFTSESPVPWQGESMSGSRLT